MLHWTIWGREPGVHEASLRKYGSKLVYHITVYFLFTLVTVTCKYSTLTQLRSVFFQNSIAHKVNKGDNASPCFRPQWISNHQTKTNLYGHDYKSYWEISWALNKKSSIYRNVYFTEEQLQCYGLQHYRLYWLCALSSFEKTLLICMKF